MTRRVRIVGLGGSLGPRSTSLMALDWALGGAREADAETERFDIRELALPMYDPHIEVPENARRLADAVDAADGLIWSSPLYHGTVSGAFKNAIDWLELLSDREPAYLTDKPVGLISTAGGVQGLQAINTLEQVVRSLRGYTVPITVPIPRAWQAFDERGQPRDERVGSQLNSLGEQVVEAAARLMRQPRIEPVSYQAGVRST